MKAKTVLGAVVALGCVSASAQTTTLGYWKLDGVDGTTVGTLQSEVNPSSMEGFGATAWADLPTFASDSPGTHIFGGLFGPLLNANNQGSVRCVDRDPFAEWGQHGGYLTFTNGAVLATGNGSEVKPFTFEVFLKVEAFENYWTDILGITRPFGCLVAGAQIAPGPSTQVRIDVQGVGLGGGNPGFNIGRWPGYYNFPDGNWHHVALLYDGDTTLYLYVDYVNYGGALVAPNKLVYDTSDNHQPSIRLGYTATAKTFGGCFDEFRLTEGMLTPDQFLRAVTLRERLQIFLPLTSGDVGQDILAAPSAYDPAQTFFSGYAVTPPQYASEVPAGTVYLQDGKDYKQRINQSALFEGSQMKVFGNNFALASAFTAETFFKIRASQNGAMLFGAADDLWQVTLENDALCLVLDSTPYPTSVTVDDAQWHHFALVGDEQQVTLYLDYEAILNVPGAFPMTDDWIYIGDESFDGWLYGVRFSGMALPVQDFLVTYKADDLNTLAHWRFDDGDVGERASIIRSADKNLQYQGYGTHTTPSSPDKPQFTNEVPGTVIWEPGTRKIRTAHNKTALRFNNADPNNPGSGSGSTLLFENVPTVLPPKLTIETFARFDAPIAYPTLIEKKGKDTTWQLDLSGSTHPRVRIDGTAAFNWSRDASKPVNNGEWHHIALQIEEVGTGNYNISFHVDYTPANSWSGVKDFGELFYTNRQIRMGSGTGRALDGWMDEPRISGSLLAPDQFLRVFVPDADPRGYWLLDGKTWENTYAPLVSYAVAEPRAFQAVQEKNDIASAPVLSTSELPPNVAYVYDTASRRTLKSVLEFSSVSAGVNAISGSQVNIPFASVVCATNFTAEVFFKVRTVTAGATILAQPDAWSVETDADGKLLARIGKQTIATTSPLSGDWHHVALVADDTSASLYLDYVLVGSIAGPVALGTDDLVLGAGANRAFDGWMHSFRYLDEPLAPSAFLKTGPMDATLILVR